MMILYTLLEAGRYASAIDMDLALSQQKFIGDTPQIRLVTGTIPNSRSLDLMDCSISRSTIIRNSFNCRVLTLTH